MGNHECYTNVTLNTPIFWWIVSDGCLEKWLFHQTSIQKNGLFGVPYIYIYIYTSYNINIYICWLRWLVTTWILFILLGGSQTKATHLPSLHPLGGVDRTNIFQNFKRLQSRDTPQPNLREKQQTTSSVLFRSLKIDQKSKSLPIWAPSPVASGTGV